jgi:phospholipase C
VTVSDINGLRRIEHIVVLMLENRSFDHLLGYLSLEGGRDDVDGLKAGMANDHAGRQYPIHHLPATYFPDERWDPDHSAAATDRQINDGAMDGFPASYAETLAARGVEDGDPGLVMGYYNASDLPVFDHFAREFCVCDRWHSSVAGATWPNRLYAIAGSGARSRDDRKVPIYHEQSFVRYLDAGDVSWRWYSHDVATLRLADVKYRVGHREHFAYVQKLKLVFKTRGRGLLYLNEDAASFLEDAVYGRLPAVSWIDPNFKDFNLIGSPPNDDHPPSDLIHGQELALLVYNALATSPKWDTTLLLVFYDEHGGMFDHVAPPEHPPDDDPATFARYGVRVPAFVISPWVKPRSVCHTLFDHATIPKTILQRFCPPALDARLESHGLAQRRDRGHPRGVGKRIAAAPDLDEVLTLSEPRPAPDRSALVDWFAAEQGARARRLLEDPAGVLRKATDHSLTDLQSGLLAAHKQLHDRGHPVGHP